ncbi:MAG: proteasome subunit beta, partial [Mycobacterium sp.]
MTWPNREQSTFPTSLPGAVSALPHGMSQGGVSQGGVTLSSFADFLGQHAPQLLPGAGPLPTDAVPHGTIIVALKYPGGVVMAGDRRATQGHMIASRDVQKVYITDDYTATGIAGTAAI